MEKATSVKSARGIAIAAIAFLFCRLSFSAELFPGVGANTFDLVRQYLGTAGRGDGSERYREVTKSMARKAIADAHDTGIGYVRFAASGYSPSRKGQSGDLDLWRKNPKFFWFHLDEMFDDLDQAQIRAIPVLMFNSVQFPAMTGETLRDLILNSESASWQLLARFVTEFVERYRDRSTVLFYELSNELNISADIDLIEWCIKNRPRPSCDLRANFTTDELIAFSQRFAKLLKLLDPKRPVSSGYSLPRPAAEHLRAGSALKVGRKDWTPDSLDQLEKNIIDLHRYVDIVSIHFYTGVYYRRFGKSEAELLKLVKSIADRMGKPLFVGEFGDRSASTARAGSAVDQMLKQIVDQRIPYSAIWVWEFYQRDLYTRIDNKGHSFSLEPGYTDYLINRLKEANMALGRPPPKPPVGDIVPPRLVLTWPLECARTSSKQKVHAVASDDSGRVERVEFWLDGKRIASDSSPPYEIEVEATALSQGVHEVEARASDLAGNVTTLRRHLVVGAPLSAGPCAAEPK